MVTKYSNIVRSKTPSYNNMYKIYY
ncbi:Uncharacterized protein GY17_00003982 [Cryptosporidium hominis]|uniref:Uncharacterized protein n=1 Tax=Cryptosporidium hominis TaxID=237895 RepID=A0ABX5B9H3_CRYHO|nr:Uncharacterized protein GY17_00003982 [Cryptosporidium hominis]|eukprot:PPS92054.1 Uncharacterized protein GY17_00003982 [Cryptosporidium hominis]